ncbi:MAG: GNAT family N-acetyltransferase [Neisseriaceae bacterium]|nr:GNAT family N-acetyltransferase [Neisseriaceae bacterium]
MRVIINNEPPSERYSHMAIMPYPRDWESRIQLKDGTPVLIRPVQDVDASAIQEFARNLSDESRYNRFMSNVKELSDNVLVRFTQLDYDREVGLIMQNEQDEILSVARYVTDPDSVECEFAVSVADNQQGKGIGSIMMNQLFEVARKQGLKSIRGDVLADNESMQGMMRKLGFTIEPDPDDETVTIVRKAL